LRSIGVGKADVEQCWGYERDFGKKIQFDFRQGKEIVFSKKMNLYFQG
jgi:hypothetical protein